MTKKRTKILICDDEAAIREVLKTMLTSEGYDVVTAKSGKEAVELFKKESPDLIILDVSMPGMTGFQALDEIRSFLGEKYIPVIFLTASIKIDDKLRALHGGAVDYLIKPVSQPELIARIKNFLELKKKHDKLKEEATFDWMTGALNKGYFLQRAKEELEKSLRNRVALTFMLIDIDRFKEINDTLGHIAGDRTIREFARRLKKVTRKVDLIGRFGGDEFVIMLAHKNKEEAKIVADRIKKVCEKAFSFEGSKIAITLSMGIVDIGKYDKAQIDKVIEDADKALYEAKAKGGNAYVMK